MNIKTFDLNLLRVFAAVYQARSVSEASVALGLSQSAVSNALKRLRGACDDPLFVRTAEGMAPTALCLTLAGPVREALSLLENSLDQAFQFDPSRSDRTFRILMSDAGEVLLLPRLVDKLVRQAPQVKIETLTLPHERYAQALESGDADLAIGRLPFFKGGRFYQQQLFHDRYRFISRSGHPLFQDGLTLERYLRASHVGISSGYADILVNAALALRKVSRDVHLKVATYQVACAIVASTDLVSIVPAHALTGHGELSESEPPFLIPDAEIQQFWHRRHHRDPACRWLRKLISEISRKDLTSGSIQAAGVPT